jgi:hypothetical protein
MSSFAYFGKSLVLIGIASLPLIGQAQTVVVTPAVQQDHLPSLRGILPKPEDLSTGRHVREIKYIPLLSAPGNVVDNSVQALPGVSSAAATTPGLGFAGVGDGDYGFIPNAAPPDTNGAMGATQYVQWVNESFAVFDKATGTRFYGPAAGNTVWAGFGGGCETNNDGDPIVKWDNFAQRWVMMQFSVSTTPYLQCVAVSATSDATGAWHRYAFAYQNFPDYPKVGVWSDAYYVTFNMFSGNSFVGAMTCAYDKAAMLAGQPASMQCVQLSTSYGGLLPADPDGASQIPPGAPNYLLNFTGGTQLNLWKFAVNWSDPTLSKLTGPIAIPVAGFTAACNGGSCIPQPSTSNKLDSLGDRLMYRLAYRYFPPTTTQAGRESLLVTHSVNASDATRRKSHTAVRWYEVRNPAGTPVIFQSGTYQPDSTSRWMSSGATDKQGNIAIGYSTSSTTVSPSIAVSTRATNDTLGILSNEVTVKLGTGSQTGSLHRWGDYASMVVDPSDDCTFWFTSEYLKNNGSFNWSTWISSFKIAGCQ